MDGPETDAARRGIDDHLRRYVEQARVDARAAGEVGGVKHDGGKLRYDLIDPAAEAWLAAALTYGAAKYGPENWRGMAGLRERCYAALRRHMAAWWAGEPDDPESGLPHLACASACVMFLAAAEAPASLGEVEERTRAALERWRAGQGKDG
jgi:hypothetical protein